MSKNQDFYNVDKNVVKRWTQSAVDRYKLGCVCSRCNIPLIMETPCQMKRSVVTLVRLYGRPDFSNFREDNNHEI